MIDISNITVQEIRIDTLPVVRKAGTYVIKSIPPKKPPLPFQQTVDKLSFNNKQKKKSK